jgi:2-polyprenyl-3-methyl-5-hydroxy-6-metoxy-1,4-benzoquinol methylase
MMPLMPSISPKYCCTGLKATIVVLPVDIVNDSRNMFRFYRGNRPNQRALDFGCGGGGAAATMRELGYSVLAYDTSTVSRKIALELNSIPAVDSMIDC